MAGTNFMEEHRSIHADVSREASGFSAYSWVLHATLGLLATFSACTAPRGPLVVSDPDPSIKIPAIEKAVRTKDRAAIPQLIKDLDSDDAAVRLYANHALEQLSGKNFGSLRRNCVRRTFLSASVITCLPGANAT